MEPKNKQLVVRYKNELNRASMKLEVQEARILLTAIAQAPSDNISDKDFYYVDADSLVSLGAAPATVYRDMKKSAESLYERSITLTEEDAKKNQSKTKFRWVQAVEYRDQEGRIGIMFSSPILPFLQYLQSEFTAYRLESIKGLSSSYAIRIFQLLMQFKSTGFYIAKVNDLKEQLMVANKFKLYGDFKRRVIDVAVKQINESEHTGITVSYREQRIGRRVDTLIFSFVFKENSGQQESSEDKVESLELFDHSLTEAQANYFASLLCTEDTAVGKDFVRKFGKGFMSYEDMKRSIATKLQNPEYYSEFRDWLVKVGYKE